MNSNQRQGAFEEQPASQQQSSGDVQVQGEENSTNFVNAAGDVRIDQSNPVYITSENITFQHRGLDEVDPEMMKQIVREELRIAHTEYGDPVGEGLNALTDLMQVPEVRAAVITFRVVFEAACDQIDVVANYKVLHDLLHTLEFQCYSGIVQEAKRFPEDETALDILMEHELILQGLLGEMQQVAVRETIATHEVQWLNDLRTAQTELHTAVDTLNVRCLQRTIWLLNRVLAIQPSRINTNLTGAARALRLTGLTNAMALIAEKLTSVNLDQKKLEQFQEGVEMLTALDQRLAALVMGHDYGCIPVMQ
ncbi:hypothetical protein [Nodosilinea nodulosa]|uniref:hypothetical protein n=1 Tax=Nodosilinea nodulosa TaxID=416001 RepID=UPI0002E18D69|nr:hypothetical protein [Nodosilinea nodulosa]